MKYCICDQKKVECTSRSPAGLNLRRVQSLMILTSSLSQSVTEPSRSATSTLIELDMWPESPDPSPMALAAVWHRGLRPRCSTETQVTASCQSRVTVIIRVVTRSF